MAADLEVLASYNFFHFYGLVYLCLNFKNIKNIENKTKRKNLKKLLFRMTYTVVDLGQWLFQGYFFAEHLFPKHILRTTSI